jgi:hypothetical protein
LPLGAHRPEVRQTAVAQPISLRQVLRCYAAPGQPSDPKWRCLRRASGLSQHNSSTRQRFAPGGSTTSCGRRRERTGCWQPSLQPSTVRGPAHASSCRGPWSLRSVCHACPSFHACRARMADASGVSPTSRWAAVLKLIRSAATCWPSAGSLQQQRITRSSLTGRTAGSRA